MNLYCTFPHPLVHSSTVSCFFKTSAPIILRSTGRGRVRASATTIPARDRVIDFGKHKGRMLGTLPSNYLKWVSKNLRARDFEEWAKLADQVLEDPVYRDRIEWELAEKVLSGDASASALARSDESAVSELVEMSERFGWNNEDKAGWSKIDFGLLGTSKGGRIPRVSEIGVEREIRLRREKGRVCEEGEYGRRRRERRERVRSKKEEGFEEEEEGDSGMNEEEEIGKAENHHSPFPGRESLLKKVLLNRRRRL